MKNLRILLFIIVVSCASISRAEPEIGRRVQMSPPIIEIVLAETSQDYIEYDNAGKPYSVDSEARFTYDAPSGSYDFMFKKPLEDDWQTARWVPRSQLCVVPFAKVSRSASGTEFQYQYVALNLKGSRQALSTFYLRAARASEALGNSSEMMFRSLPGNDGISTNVFWNIKGSGSVEEGKKTGETMEGMLINAKGYPTVVICCAEGVAPLLSATSELPSSVEMALMPYKGIFSDCVTGLTVGPGLAEPTLTLLRSYLPICRFQGWAGSAEYARLNEQLYNAEQQIGTNPDDRLKVLKDLLKKVTEITQGKYTEISPGLDALIRLNVEAMVVLSEGEQEM